MSVLSLGLLLPFGAGTSADRAIAILQDAAASVSPAKHVHFVHGTADDEIVTHASTIERFLAERGVVPQAGDRIDVQPNSSLCDGATVAYTAAVDVTVVADGVARRVRTANATVGGMLDALRLPLRKHDTVTPAAETALVPNAIVKVTRVTSWLERFRTRIAPPIARKFDVSMRAGTQRIVDPGRSGTNETTVAVLQPTAAVAPKRLFLAERVLRLPRTKIVAEGVGGQIALGEIAHRGFVGTMRLADAALKMIATAYTARCSGCSGLTTSGRVAGRGVVAVDPRVIPLGSRLFIPGYGHAFAGDTGGSIHGNRIDLGFDSSHDALTFGRRPIVVYVLK